MFILSVMNHWLSLKKAVFVAAHANICKSFAKGKLPYSGLHRPFNTSLARALNLFLLMVAMLLSAINGTIFLVSIAASSLTPLFEKVTLIIWSCCLRVKEPFGFNRFIALCIWEKIYCTMWCLSPPRCINGYQRLFVREICRSAEGGRGEVTRDRFDSHLWGIVILSIY